MFGDDITVLKKKIEKLESDKLEEVKELKQKIEQ
jgi:hypothetical protein